MNPINRSREDEEMDSTRRSAGIWSESTVNELIRSHPDTREVFSRFGIDTCCGGAAPVSVAAATAGADQVALSRALEAVIGDMAGEDRVEGAARSAERGNGPVPVMKSLARPEAPDAVAIGAGHRALLETLRDLVGGREEGGRALDEDALRGVLAFLRQGVVPFARWEERALRGAGEVWEGAAFEHAFLEVEIDRLAREAAEVSRGEGGLGTAAARARRTLHRIEAVLEVHALRADDRGVFAAPPAPANLASTRSPQPIRP